jgi:hypothetical protein
MISQYMSVRLAAAAALGVLMVVPTAASAQVLMQRDVSLRMALTIAEAALAECGDRTSVAVVDRAGRLCLPPGRQRQSA